MPNDAPQLPADPETLMRGLAATIHQHAGPTSSGRLAAISIPVLGIDDVHFSTDGEPTIAFYTGGGEMTPRVLDAEECQALSGFFAGLANLLGFRS